MSGDRLEQLFAFLETEPNDSFLKYAIATEYLKLNEDEKALQYFRDLVAVDEHYVGTYYHLGKLYEKLDRKTDAEAIYKKGLIVAGKAKNMHAAAELRQVLNALLGLDYEDD